MNNFFELIGRWFIAFNIVIIPFIFAVYGLFLVFFRKSVLKKAGKIIHSEKNHEKNNNIFAVVGIIGFAFILMFSLLEGIKEAVILVIVFLPLFSGVLLKKSYKRVSGIYENGIIANGFISWKQMFSWELFTINTISFTKKNGEVLTYMNLENIDLIIDLLEKENLKRK